MLNPRLKQLPDHTWDQLRALLDPLSPGRAKPLSMTIGAPQHPMPSFVIDILEAERAGYGKYPPILGTPDWQQAVTGWLSRRYGLSDIDPSRHLLPVSGTREGLFNAAFIAVPETKAGKQPAVLMPNPFYQTYAAAAVSAGAEPIYVSATPDNDFMPDFTTLSEATLARTALIFLCSPANPQGTVATRAYLEALVSSARAHDFVLIADECYGEIYTQTAPLGILEVCRDMAATSGLGNGGGNPYANILSFHSLSKRSNMPGLRSGFVVGDPTLIAAYGELRSYGGSTSPLPVFAAAAAAWNDDDHVQENQALYRVKFDIADRIIGNRFGYRRPEGGFFLWLDVGDGEKAATHLWQTAGVRVLPGRYLAREDDNGYNPGAAYIRVALVQSPEMTEEALSLISETL